jgi:glucose/arabinose dehydrogenase
LAGSAALLAILCGSAPASAQNLIGAAATDLDLKNYAKGLSKPTDIVILPDGRGVVTQQLGDVLVFTNGVKSTAGHLPVEQNNGEQGLLGVVADPNFANNHYLYFYADIGAAANKHTIVRIVLGNDNMLGTQTVILGPGAPTPGIYGPANHNGGAMVIYENQLYIGVGDTGANATPPTNKFGSCLNQANGKILRINLDGTVPADNPLSNVPMVTACTSQNSAFTMAAPDKRIWAWGFRNPFRFWIDPSGPAKGTMWIGDVGEVTREEVTVGKGDSHYGYPFVEGTKDWGPTATNGPANECMGMTPARPCTPAVFDYPHANGDNCIIGGPIMGGCGWPAAWASRYVFGDHGSGNVWTLDVNGGRTGVMGGSTPFAKVSGPSSFRMGLDNALYIVEVDGGAVERVTPKMQPANCGIPDGGLPPTPDAGGGVGGSNGAGGTNGAGGVNGAGGANNGAGGANNATGAGGSANGAGGTSSGTSMTGVMGAGGDLGVTPAAEDTGGCGCRSAASGPMGLGAGFAMVGTIAAGLLRRRRGSRRKQG